MRSITSWRFGILLALVCSAGLLLAACGGGSSSTNETTATEAKSGGEGSETAEIVPEPPTTPITEFPIGPPLKTTPPEHMKVIWLACELPTCQGDLSKGYKDASAVLGWDFEQINYNPLKAAEAVQGALDKNPDAIFITGIDPSAFEAQAKEAIRKEIPIFNGFSAEEPDPETNGVYMNYFSAKGWGLESKQIAAWAINNSGGEANVLIVSVPEYPVVIAQQEAAEEEYAKCPKCTVGSLNVSVEDIGAGKGPAKIVAYLQQHPDIDYIHFTFGDLLQGLESAMEAAGVGSDVKLTGIQLTETIAQELVDGKVAAWAAQPDQFVGWFSVDAAIRNAQGMPLTKYQLSGEGPTWVVDSPAAAEKILEEGGQWPGPEGFQKEYEELWGL